MKKLTVSMLTIIFFALCIGCKKDDLTPCQRLEGKWKCESWREDGEEELGYSLSSFRLEIEELNGSDGDFEWIIVTEDGDAETITGEYEVNSNCTELEFSSSGGTTAEMDFEIDGDELALEGNVDGYYLELKFERD